MTEGRRRWQRSAGLDFPVCFNKFSAGDKLVEFRVEDIPPNRYDEACKFMIEHFVPYEPKLVARNAHNDFQLHEDYYKIYMWGITQKVSVACFAEGSDEFVGVNILEVLGRNDDTICHEFKSQNTKDITNAVKYIEKNADIFHLYDVEHFLSGTGLAIHPSYRKYGIATEMLKARKNILNFFHLKITSTGFSSIGAQKAATRYRRLCDKVDYDELAQVNNNWDFRGTDTEKYIQMTTSFE